MQSIDTHHVSKRLQVLLPDQEMTEISISRRERLTVGEWVRRTPREPREQQPASDPESKLRVVRRAAEFSFPTVDIADMLSEHQSDAQARLERLIAAGQRLVRDAEALQEIIHRHAAIGRRDAVGAGAASDPRSGE
jgi:hypothetical protein